MTRLQSQQGFAVVKSDLHSMGTTVESRLEQRLRHSRFPRFTKDPPNKDRNVP